MSHLFFSQPLSLVRAERYSDPGEPSAILPDVYGDLTVGGIRGPIPAVLIDRATNTYGIATPMTSVTAVYEEETDVTGSATVTLSNDFQSQGLITTIAFASPRFGQITVRGIGKVVDGDNPISQLEDLLGERAGADASHFVTAELERARAVAADLGFTTAWVIADDQPAGAWIAEFMLNVFGGAVPRGDGRLSLWLEGDAWSPNDLVSHIVAHRDCLDGDDGVRMVGTERDLCNALTVHYLFSWPLNQPSSRLTDLTDALSINAYGEMRKSVTLRGHRDAAQVATWASRFFDVAAARTRVEGAVLTFTVKGSKMLHATVGDRIAFSWPYGPTREEGHPYVNEVLRVLGVVHTLGTAPRTEVTALSLGRYLTEDLFFDPDEGGSLGDGYFNADDYFGGGRQLAELA